MMNAALFYLAVVASVALALPAAPLEKRVLLPALDSFYSAPPGFESAAPGTVLKSRQVNTATLGIIPTQDVIAWQLLYRTNGAIDNSPDVTVTTVIQPTDYEPDKVVSYQFAEDSNNKICAPSYNLQLGALQTNAIIAAEANNIALLLLQKWTVVISDYEQSKSAFGAGRLAGRGVLDGIRAALSFPVFKLSPSSRVVGWGYSGGAIATGWAAALQPSYAPAINVVGWAHGGTPANVSGTLAFIDGTLFAGFGFAGVAGLGDAYPTIQSLLDTYTTLLGKAAIRSVRNQCAVSNIIQFAFQKLQSKTYQSFGDQLLFQPTVKAVTDQNILGRQASETPGAPLYIYHALYDQIIPISDANRMVQSYCRNGVSSLHYETDIGLAEHASAEILFTPRAIQFLKARLDGDAATPGCTFANTTSTQLVVDALGSASRSILQAQQNLLDTRIGVDDRIWESSLR